MEEFPLGFPSMIFKNAILKEISRTMHLPSYQVVVFKLSFNNKLCEHGDGNWQAASILELELRTEGFLKIVIIKVYGALI